MPEVTVSRVLTHEQARALVGDDVALPYTPTLPRARPGDPVWVRDADTGAVIGIITVLSDTDRARVRAAVLDINTDLGVARMNRKQKTNPKARTFGWAPKRIVIQYEACHATTMVRDHPAAHAVLSRLSLTLTDEFAALLPEQAAADQQTITTIKGDWRMEEGSLWTSGVVNDTALLPYHLDKQNLPTWSAMPSIRYGVDGGHLHLPEYDLVFPCRDGEVTWFLGRELVHGVTPMRKRRPDGYRFTIVYYAIAAMKNCATYAEETRAMTVRRTERERTMAEGARQRLIAEYADTINAQGTMAADT